MKTRLAFADEDDSNKVFLVASRVESEDKVTYVYAYDFPLTIEQMILLES